MFLTHDIFCQFKAEGSAGFVGETIEINFKYEKELNSARHFIFEADMYLSNPTVFFPIGIHVTEGIEIDSFNIFRITDSTFRISLSLVTIQEFEAGNQLFQLRGELLAGNDSICNIEFANAKFDDKELEDFSFTVKSSSPWGYSPYIRFASIIDNYPNPVYTGQETHWIFLIDKSSKVKFWLYDLQMKGILIKDLGIIDKGVHEFHFTPTDKLSAGLYWIELESNSGSVFKPLIILR